MTRRRAISPLTTLLRHLSNGVVLCRLHRPADLLLIWLALLQGGWLASGGPPAVGPVVALLMAATLFRSALWSYNDLMEQRLMAMAPESLVAKRKVSRGFALWVSVGLSVVALLLLPFELTTFAYALFALLLALGYPFIKLRSYLLQPYMALGVAWAIPLAYAVLGVAIDRAGWLLALANLLLATAAFTLYALPRHDYEQKVGIRSLAQLVGEGGSFALIPLLQWTALFALSLIGKQAKLGPLYDSGLYILIGLFLYQALLLHYFREKGATRQAFRLQIWMGVVLFGGLYFSALCVCG